MAKFLTTLRAQAEIENIMNNAKNSLVLISPYVNIGDNLLQSLKEADRRKVKVTFVYGDKRGLKPEARSQFDSQFIRTN